MGDSTGGVPAENYHPGGKEFIVTVQDYTPQGMGSVLNQSYINSRALSGVMTTGSSQVFANEDNAGTKNVGVVIFSIQDPISTFNVLSVIGSSCPIYSVVSPALNNSSWKFSTRVQKIDPTLNVTSGSLISHALMDIYYEQQTKCCKYYLAA